MRPTRSALKPRIASMGRGGTDATWTGYSIRTSKAREDVHRKIRGRKAIKFHDNPVLEKSEATCAGIDC